MTLDRRRFLLASTAGLGTALAAPALASLTSGTTTAGVPDDAPQTGFERRAGASWTTHEEELDFLAAVAARSSRLRLEVLTETPDGRPLHLVTLGTGRTGPGGLLDPSMLFLGSQHGNEPAGREACLALLRDLALTDDPVLVRQLAEQTVLVVPSANPDGRARNSRANARGVDLNRDHLALTQPETRALATVVRDLAPHVALDLHEYGPSVPVVYDDEVLYLWPRNLNVDAAVRDLSRSLCEQYVAKGARAAGYTADEYGLYKVGEERVTQTAGDEDEGICRNLMGLRHVLGVLVESAVSADVRNGVDEAASSAAVMRRRVASQRQVVADALRFLREQGDVARFASRSAALRKAQEGRERSAPVYWGGADDREPTAAEQLFPPPAGYLLDDAQLAQVGDVLALHGAVVEPVPGGGRVPLGQPAEPVLPLLLDARADRDVVQAQPY